ncbi:DedA family protein [Saccharopolyspora phatthalungensis]|uniref:Membrane protein DedA with SNARE-associated domain n=1 Tax=Saccharopolyspora phatthalungensis TaxID=664693 RepID=A0A840QKV4_9PSEU|nr:DedA family protein [Saccharopolyspora phatthalungensis]MBB5159553.1 membrane protein DedA with SNARE-associated domain [Saccharopolyspora phatthalungensis]
MDFGGLFSSLAQLPLPLVIAAAGALTLAECTIGLGLIVPGETGLLIAASAITNLGGFVAMVLVVTVCATTGDTFGYWLGHRYGHRLRETRLIGRLGRQHWDRAADQLRKHGAGAVFVGRFLPMLRTLTPAASGTSRLPFRRFLPASASGALCWSTLHVGIGTGAGASARYIEDVLGQASWIVLLAVVAVAVVVFGWWKIRARRRARPNTRNGTATRAFPIDS